MHSNYTNLPTGSNNLTTMRFKLGDRVISPDGEGIVCDIHPEAGITKVQFAEDAYWYTSDQLTGTTGPANKSACEYNLHDWVMYRGFTHEYEYCKNCDKKKD